MSRVEELLGRAIQSDERQSVDALYELRPEQLADVALLLRAGRVPAIQYLQTIVRHSHLDHVAEFLDRVIVGGADPGTWGNRDQFCTVELELAPLVQLTLADFEVLLAPVGAKQWQRVVPNMASWDGTAFCGAPGIVKTAAPYWLVCDAPVTCIDAAVEKLEIVSDLEVAFRRWLASRIAWEYRGRPRPSTMQGWQQVLDAQSISTDAQYAVQALMVEDESDAAPDLPPGFRAPDRVLRGDTPTSKP